jgi:hypothetical protein
MVHFLTSFPIFTKFIAEQHAQGPDGYMTAIDNVKAVWKKTHPGLRFGSPVPYRCVRAQCERCACVVPAVCAHLLTRVCVCVCVGG